MLSGLCCVEGLSYPFILVFRCMSVYLQLLLPLTTSAMILSIQRVDLMDTVVTMERLLITLSVPLSKYNCAYVALTYYFCFHVL